MSIFGLLYGLLYGFPGKRVVMGICKGMTRADKERIKYVIQSRVTKPCARCDKREFILLDGYINQPIYKQLGADTKEYVASVVLICNYCGSMNQYAVEVVDLMPEEIDK